MQSEPEDGRQNGRETQRGATERKNSPLVDEGEPAVDGAARDELGGHDVGVFGGLVGAVGQRPAHRHQAGQVGGLRLRIAVRVLQQAARPAVHVAGAVEGAVFGRVCGPAGERVEHENTKQVLKKKCLGHMVFLCPELSGF